MNVWNFHGATLLERSGAGSCLLRYAATSEHWKTVGKCLDAELAAKFYECRLHVFTFSFNLFFIKPN